ncbi:8995_t:CDS:1 [Funneliformis geosporum]|uniref:15879_t:CDS:1 n=1 Tax=Funneliformis geosporum TaxID=1117311 RepID=A0A9W4SSE0_9GLOM|nr:8995_t:CDS:1 [Funneliformis geosporum]CAI2179701.1 15879_t:CDS:1 [Funneliformis geosporum]
MSAVILPELCLIKIFEELKNNFVSLYSCVLVNRHWCTLALPELWKNPFDVINDSNLKGVIKANIRLLNTYISCLSEDTRKNFGLKSFTKSPLFDYGIYLQYLHLKIIHKSIYIWLNFGDPVVFKLKSTTKKRKVSIDDEQILKALCEYFVNRSTRIKGVDLSYGTYLNVFDLPNADLNLLRLQNFKFGMQCNSGAVSSAAKITKNISTLDINLIDAAPYPKLITSLNDIVRLIKSQKNLKQITLCCSVSDFSEIINSLSIHYETLTHINLHHINFEYDFPLAEFAEYLNLNYLEIDNCKFIRGKMTKQDLKPFQKLHSILIKNTNLPFEILEYLFCQANNSLQVLELSANSTDFDRLENICLKFCPNIKKFITTKQSSYDHIISMVNACKNLEEIYIYEDQEDWHEGMFNLHLSCNSADANKFLRALGKILPSSVHTIKYSLDWPFDPKSLEIFLDHFQPRKFMLLEFHDCSFFSDKHLNVIIKVCGKTLKKLHIDGMHNLHHIYVLERRHQFLGELYVEEVKYKRWFVDSQCLSVVHY